MAGFQGSTVRGLHYCGGAEAPEGQSYAGFTLLDNVSLEVTVRSGGPIEPSEVQSCPPSEGCRGARSSPDARLVVRGRSGGPGFALSEEGVLNPLIPAWW